MAEIKSITADNEEEQLRLGLGQVLRYRQRLLALGHECVVAVLVPERQPHDPFGVSYARSSAWCCWVEMSSTARLSWRRRYSMAA